MNTNTRAQILGSIVAIIFYISISILYRREFIAEASDAYVLVLEIIFTTDISSRQHK
jgi:hypothetical protein